MADRQCLMVGRQWPIAPTGGSEEDFPVCRPTSPSSTGPGRTGSASQPLIYGRRDWCVFGFAASAPDLYARVADVRVLWQINLITALAARTARPTPPLAGPAESYRFV